MSTYAQVMDRGAARSRRNVPRSSLEDTEYLDVIYRALRAAVQRGHDAGPESFGDLSDPVAFADPGWPRPAGAEVVFRVEQEAEEVLVVPLDDRFSEPGPSIYQLGGTYRSVGREQDPAPGDELIFFSASWPDAPESAADEIDTRWPAEFDPILELEFAIHLAASDAAEARAGEIGALRAELEEWNALWVAHVATATTLRTRFG